MSEEDTAPTDVAFRVTHDGGPASSRDAAALACIERGSGGPVLVVTSAGQSVGLYQWREPPRPARVLAITSLVAALWEVPRADRARLLGLHPVLDALLGLEGAE